jgi:hypothetical protein
VVCLEAGVISQKLPPFALSTRSLPKEWEDRVDLSLLKDVAFALTPGKTSRFEMARDGKQGIIVHLVSRLPVDDAKLKTEMPAFVANLREQRQREALNQWFRKELDQAHLSFPSSGNKSGSN